MSRDESWLIATVLVVFMTIGFVCGYVLGAIQW